MQDSNSAEGDYRPCAQTTEPEAGRLVFPNPLVAMDEKNCLTKDPSIGPLPGWLLLYLTLF